MTTITVTEARKNIYKLLKEVNNNSEPVTITNSRGGSAILISEADWKAIQETMYLSAIPGLAESIVEGGNTPIKDCLSEDEVEW